MGLGGLLGLAAGAHFTRNYDTEYGYFAESGEALLNLESGQRKWGLPFPTVNISYLNSRNSQIPDLKLQVSLLRIKF